MSIKLEEHIPVVRQAGINTDKDINAAGAFDMSSSSSAFTTPAVIKTT